MNRRKIICLILTLCLLISVVPMAVSAETINPEPTTPPAQSIPEAPTAPEGAYTVEVSATGTYTTLIDAYNAAVEYKGATSTDPIAIRVLSNTSMTAHLDFSKYAGTVYIYGVATDGVYPTVSGPTAATTFITLGADTVFYDINLAADGSGKSLVIQAAFHKLTLGRNFGTPCTNGALCKVTGAVWSCSNADYYDNVPQDTNKLPSQGANISIYSGTYDVVTVTWRENLSTANSKDINYASVANVYGGTMSRFLDVNKTNGSNTTQKASIECNILGGKITAFRSYVGANSTKYTTLNYALGTINTLGSEAGLVSKNIINASYVGVQHTADESEKYSIRFVGVVDSSEYEAIGFKITREGKDYGDVACAKLYSSVAGNGNDYTAEALGGKLIFAYAINGIPTTAGKVTFTVQPYVVKGGTTYYGTSYDVTYNAGAYVSSAATN